MTEVSERVPGRRLGRRPPSNAPALMLAPLLTGVVPQHPASADDLSRVTDWGMYGNDQFGTCGPTSVANSLKALSVYAGETEREASLDDVFDLYRRSGNPGFDPATDTDDNGVVMQDMLDQLLKGGIGGYRPVAFAKVDTSNLDEVRAAISIFGSVLFGVTLDVVQQQQTDEGIWDYRRSNTWGGHAIPAGAYTSSLSPGDPDVSVITWTETVGCTDSFLENQLDEAWVVIWPEHLAHPAFQAGVNLDQLAADYKSLTGRDFPNVTPPAPAPTPPPPAPGPSPSLWDEVKTLVEEFIDKLRNLFDGR